MIAQLDRALVVTPFVLSFLRVLGPLARYRRPAATEETAADCRERGLTEIQGARFDEEGREGGQGTGNQTGVDLNGAMLEVSHCPQCGDEYLGVASAVSYLRMVTLPAAYKLSAV